MQTTEWLPGAPAHITQETLEIDAQAVDDLACPACLWEGGSCVPLYWHQGKRYQVQARCTQCGYLQEM